MASNPIKSQELIDIDGLRQKIAEARSDYKAFVDEVTQLNTQMQRSLLANKAALESYQKINAGTDNVREQEQLAQRVTLVGQQYKDQKAALAALIQTEQLHSQVTGSLIQRQEQLIKEYATLEGNTARVVSTKKRLAKEMVDLQNQLERAGKSARVAADGAKEAQGQYNALQKELADARLQLKNLSGAFDENTGKINRNNAEAVRLAGIIQRNDTMLRKFDQTLGLHNRNIGNYPKMVDGAVIALNSLATRFLTLDAVINSAKWFYAQSRDLEAYDRSLREVSRSEADFARSKLFLIELADKLGVEYTTLIDKYKLLKDATKDTALEGEITQQIFTSITTAGAKMALSNEVIEGTLRAVIQMISKGKVQMEELRGQLGERLPSAMRLMAAALGVSETKLNKMAEQGELIATEVMPKFAKEIGEAYSLKNNEKIASMAASTARVKNETSLLVEVLNSNKGVSAFWDGITSGAQRALRNIRLFVQDGSWKELVTFVGPNSLSSRMTERRDKEDAVNAFAGLGEGDRYLKLQELRQKEADQERQGLENEARKTREIRRKLQDMDLQATVLEIQQKRRTEGIAEKDAVAKNEEDLTRFQKLSARKRTAEILALEQQLAKDKSNSVLVNKLDAYNKLDIEQRAKEKAVADRIKLNKGKTDAELQRERDEQLREVLAYNRQSNSAKVAGLDAAHESGAMGDVDYLSQRLLTQQNGVLKEQEILRKAGKQNTAEYEETQKQLNEIAADYLDKRNKLEEDAFRLAMKATQDAIAEDETLVKTGLSERLVDLESAYEREVTVVKNAITQRKISQVQGDAQLHDLRIRYIDDVQRATLAANDTEKQAIERRVAKLREQGKTEKEIAEATHLLKEKLDKLEQERLDALAKGDIERVKETEAKKQKLLEGSESKKREILEKAVEVAIAAASGYTDLVSSFAQRDIERLEKQKEYELNLVGDNAEAKAAITAKYDKQEREIKRKAAITEKAAALFSIAINTAVNASKELSNPFLLALTIALGAVQAAVVAAKPIPEFWKGTSNAPEGPAWVGERGYELIESKQGGKPSYRLAAEKQLMYLNAHDRVMTHQETKQFLRVNNELVQDARTAPGGSQFVQPVVVNNSGITKADLLDAFASQPIEQTILDDGELKKYLIAKQQRIERKNKMFSLPLNGKSK